MFGWLKSILENIRNINSSLDEFKKDTVIQSLPSYTYVKRAKKALEKDDYTGAETILLQALELPQKDSLVYKYLGVTYERQGKFDLAVENYQISADIEPHDKMVWQRLGFALISYKEYERAEKSFENADKIQSGNTDTLTGWGMALMKQQKYSEAREKFTTASKYNRYNFSAIFLCAVMEIKLEMYDKAESKLAFLANVAPNESNTFEYARLYAIKDDYDNAIYYAKKSLEINAKMFPSYVLLGQMYSEKFDFVNSNENFELAEKISSDNAEMYLHWGKLLQNFERFDDAKEKLLKALELDNGNIEIFSQLALCSAQRNELEEAENFIEKIQGTEENNKIRLAKAIIHIAKNEFEEALKCLRSNSENWLFSYYIAKCYEKSANKVKAKEYYENSIAINPKYISGYVSYVNFLISDDNFEDAQRKLRKALKFNENNSELLNLMFYVSYILVKDSDCEYNIKEALAITQKFENAESFRYPEYKAELEKLLRRIN